MSWLFSRALVEEYSGGNSSGGEPSAPLSVMPTPHKFWRNDKTMESCDLSRFGLTCAVLTAVRGAELLTAFREAFPVRTFRPPVRGRESKGSVPVSGLNLRGSFAKYVPDSRLWRTHQSSLLGGYIAFSGTWPKWGSMQSGAVSRLRTPSGLVALRALIMSGKESGSSEQMPTPTASTGGPEPDRPERKNGHKLATAVARAPTPRAADGTHAGTTATATTARRVMAGQANLSEFTLETLRVPTPHGFSKDGKSNGPSGNELGRAVNRLGTPTTGNKVRSKAFAEGRALTPLEFVRSVPSPTATDATKWNRKTEQQRREQGSSVRLGNVATDSEGQPAGGSLNPPWVEWLMGWPIEWTALKPLETDKFQQWLHSHGGC